MRCLMLVIYATTGAQLRARPYPNIGHRAHMHITDTHTSEQSTRTTHCSLGLVYSALLLTIRIHVLKIAKARAEQLSPLGRWLRGAPDTRATIHLSSRPSLGASEVLSSRWPPTLSCQYTDRPVAGAPRPWRSGIHPYCLWTRLVSRLLRWNCA